MKKISQVPSPCISVCTLDEEYGLCKGCLRNAQEIADWPQYDDEQKRALLHKLEARRLATPHEHNGSRT